MQARLVDLHSMIGDNSRNSYIDKEIPSIRPESNQFPSSSMVMLQYFLSHFDLYSSVNILLSYAHWFKS